MIKKFPNLEEVDEDKKPENFPVKIGHKFKNKELSSGYRMQVYESISGQHVLRIPKKTEGQLCDISEESEANVMDWEGNIHAVSEFTYDEIARYRFLHKVLRKHIVRISHFHGFDNAGALRTFSIQRRVRAKIDLVDFPLRIKSLKDELSDYEKIKLKSFINLTKILISKYKLIPDLANSGNLVIEENGKVSLIDINNIRDVLDNKEWLNPKFLDYENLQLMREIIYLDKRLRNIFHSDYLDEFLIPIADKSISRLKNMELSLEPEREEEIQNDSIYNNYLNELRRDVIIRIDRLRFM